MNWIPYFDEKKGYTAFSRPFSISVLTYDCGESYRLALSTSPDRNDAVRYFPSAEEAMAAAPIIAAELLESWKGAIVEKQVERP